MPPTSDEQIRFMVNIQRLLDEGLFTASYKFALLLALAVLSIEQGDDSGAPLELTTDAIAEKFVQYYWRQAVPYATPGEATILQQNTDRQATIVNLVREARASYGDSLTTAMRDLAGWRRLVRKVARVVREMPLWRLQRIGAEQLNFLYENEGDRGVIQLLPGIAFCFRKFHALISDLVQGAWVRYVRQQNLTLIGETADLHEFLFGSERNSLAMVRPILLDLQHGRCFYCNRGIIGETAHVDHFVAWARYPVDLAHNFVLADSRCNNQKRDRLPACQHLAAWTERNAQYGAQLGDALRTTWDHRGTRNLQPGCVRADGGSARVYVVARGRDGAAGGCVAGPDPLLGKRWCCEPTMHLPVTVP